MREPAEKREDAASMRVAVLIVTWNRKDFVSDVLRAVAGQTYPRELLNVVVIDNAGTDGTLGHLVETFRPERVVENPTHRAEEPRFEHRRNGSTNSRNRLGFASLTIVRNDANLGGCGGFNTGFAFVEWAGNALGLPRPDVLWLVDDDVDLPVDALDRLVRTMERRPDAGLVGSRTVDIRDRIRTIETTIYYNSDEGIMQDHAPSGSPHRGEFAAFEQRFGGPKGTALYTGTMDVDVVSACSMLARWDAVVGGKHAGTKTPVGFWDARYFIYCDDADWCLRFARNGWRVVLCLDAVVYHTPWNLKLTPARIYYANRNKIWMSQKVLPTPQLRRVTRRAMWVLLKDALRASLVRRIFHAEIILATGVDAAIGRAGKTGSDGPPGMPVIDALEKSGVLRGGRTGRVLVMCSLPESLTWMAALQRHVEDELVARGMAAEAIQWIAAVRNDVVGGDGNTPPLARGARQTIVYGPRLLSRLKKQWHLWRARPDAVVVFEQTNDLPVLGPGVARFNLHIDQKKPTTVQLERDGWWIRLRFLGRWMVGACRCWWFSATIKPFSSTSKYG